MAWFRVRGAWLIFALFFTGAVALFGRPATGPWKPVRLFRVDYVLAEDLAKQYGLRLVWLEKRQRVRLENNHTKIEFKLDAREMSWNGLRVYLGEPIARHRDTLGFSLADVRSTLEPLMRPRPRASQARPRLIVIDAGHGGKDSGTANGPLKLQEKTFALDVARRLEAALKGMGYKTVMTRSTDKFLSLDARPALANRAGADLFISVHFNALGNNAGVHGIETYSFTPAGQRSTAAHVRRSADQKAQPGNRHDHWNTILSATIHRQLIEDLNAFDRGMKRGRFAVLRNLNCPAVLVEGGFLSNNAEARKIATPSYREKIARAIAGGVQRYVAALEASPPVPVH